MTPTTRQCFRVVVYLGNGLDTILGPFATRKEASEACRPYILQGYTADDFVIQQVQQVGPLADIIRDAQGWL